MHHKHREKQSIKKSQAKLYCNTNNSDRKRKLLLHPTDLQHTTREDRNLVYPCSETINQTITNLQQERTSTREMS